MSSEMARKAQELLRQCRFGVLSTLSADVEGYPFGSLVPYALDEKGRPLIHISGLAQHTRNVRQDARVSLTLFETGVSDIQQAARLTWLGLASPVPGDERPSAEQRYRERFPDSQRTFALPDFVLYRIDPVRGRFIAGFGEIEWLSPEDLIPQGESPSPQGESPSPQGESPTSDSEAKKVESPRDLGGIVSTERHGRGARFTCESGGLCDVTFLRPGTVWVRMTLEGQFLPRRTFAVTRTEAEFPDVSFEIVQRKERFLLRTRELSVALDTEDARVSFLDRFDAPLCVERDVLRWEAGSPEFTLSKCVLEGDRFYGFGEHTGMLERSSQRHTCWTSDDTQHGPGTESMYQAIPFYMVVNGSSRHCYGVFLDCTYKSSFDVGGSDPETLKITGEGKQLSYYLFQGEAPADVLERYTELTGRCPLPPLWSVGYHQSRWSYSTASQLDEVAQGLRENRIPCDVIHLDIEYMHGYRVFTFDKEAFPDPAAQIQRLRDEGFRVVTIVDPGVKYDPDGSYAVYEDGLRQDVFLKDEGGEPFRGFVWPGESVFPDFTLEKARQWWGEQHQALLDAGVSGIWNDMNEPAIFTAPFDNGAEQIPPPVDLLHGRRDEPDGLMRHAEVRNLYGYLMCRATREGLEALHPGERPFVLTRSGYAGIQRLAAVWMGDNRACWEHLEMMLPQLCNMGMSGVPFVGVDIGGFFGDPSPELYARWFEMGALLPFCRAHSARDTRRAEPWCLGEEVTETVRRHLELRYRLLPYLYTLFREAETQGSPILRPLVYQYPWDPEAATLVDQVLVGSDLMACPVTRPGVTHRAVYFPEEPGGWYDFWTGEHHPGGGHHLAETPLGRLPLWVRGGAVLPLGPVKQSVDERPLDVLTLLIHGAGEARGSLYEDDGLSMDYREGVHCVSRFSVFSGAGGRLVLQGEREGRWSPAPRKIEIVHRGSEPSPTQALNGPVLLPLEEDSPGYRTVLDEPAGGSWTVEFTLE